MSRVPPWFAAPSAPTEGPRPVERIVPSDAEARNGWTEESLTAYVAERRAAQDVLLDPTTRRRPSPQKADGPMGRSVWLVQERRWTVGRRGFNFGPGRGR